MVIHDCTCWSCKYHVLTKKSKILLTTCVIVTQRHGESNPQPLYHRSAGGTTMVPVCCILGTCSEILLNIEATDYRSIFAKTILFENCSCFIHFSISVESPTIYQCLISIPAGHWVRQIDGKSSAITWPILFVSFTQPCDQHDRKIRTICKSAVRWRGRRARGYRKLILCANLLYVPNIKM